MCQLIAFYIQYLAKIGGRQRLGLSLALKPTWSTLFTTTIGIACQRKALMTPGPFLSSVWAWFVYMLYVPIDALNNMILADLNSFYRKTIRI